MHGNIKIEFKDKICIFWMHYREGLSQDLIAERKGISRSYVAKCIGEIWDWLKGEGILKGE
ncbi:MAG TPA: hypothetical protein VFG06_10990 [Thermodesulfovibrionales bacterium]|nr:hypothetical protein [Thermodesulfovibrionales bacterium]